MTIFLDTEFTRLSQSGKLISLALVSLDGGWFYAEFTDYDAKSLSDWHQKHVIANLMLPDKIRPAFVEGEGVTVLGETKTVVTALRKWLNGFPKVEIWADVLAYDWVFFCELFGGALEIPKQIFYMPFDFPTFLKTQGIDPDIARELLASKWADRYKSFKHNALYDAYLTREAYRTLVPGTVASK